MYIELLDNFRGKKPGDRIHWPDNMAQILIDQKRAKEVKEGAPVKAFESAPVDKMQRKSKQK